MAIFRIPVNLTWPYLGSPGVNVWHLRTTEASGTPSNSLIIDDALEVLQTFYASVFEVNAATGLTYSCGGDIVDVETQEGEPRPGFSGSVAVAGGSLPPQNQVCITWRTTLRARRGRGRTFVGPLRPDRVSPDGTLADAARTSIADAAAAFVAASQGIAGGAFAVYGQQNEGNPVAKVARDITGSFVPDKVAVLRSRRD